MTGRAAFTSAEWRALTRTPADVMFGVIIVSYGGYRRELGAVRKTLHHADTFPAETELVSELGGFVAANAEKLRRDAETREFDRRLAIARAHDDCRGATNILRRRATAEEREEYGRFVLWCGQRVALAGVEGGFLRIGGRRLGHREVVFLDSVADSLDVSWSSI